VGDPSLWEPTPWAMGVAHAPKNHRAQGALLQKPTHPAKQLGSDPNSLTPILLTPILQMWVCGFCKMPVKREQVRIRAPLEDCAAMLSAMDE